MAEAKQERLSQADVLKKEDLAALIDREFRPVGAGAHDQIQHALATLAERALRETTVVSDDAIGTIKAIIAEIDQKLTLQVNEIIHHPQLQQLEGTWRGLHYLVNDTETSEQLKIKIFNVSKLELGKTLKRYKGTAWDQSPIFKKVYEEGYGTLGGEPFGCLVGDYSFDHSPPDVELLSGMSQIAAAAHAPFIAGASPTLMGMDSWQELSNPRDLTKIFQTPEYAAWRRKLPRQVDSLKLDSPARISLGI